MCVCMLDHFLIVMRYHVQIINTDMFITYPAIILAVATESLVLKERWELSERKKIE